MAKTRSKWSESVYHKRLKEGRGQGEKESYKPWLTIHDLASKGYATRIMGDTVHRIYHLLSHNELYYFCLLDWSEKVLDIREQFPMRLTETLEIARNAGIRHPWDNRSGFPYVMTTDFLITTDKGLEARTVKSTDELSNWRTREKFEIERRYWSRCGITWKIVTEEQIDVQKAQNILWLKTGVQEEKLIPDPRMRSKYEHLFLQLYEDCDVAFSFILESLDQMPGMMSGAGMSIFKALIKNGNIRLNLSEPINMKDPRRV